MKSLNKALIGVAVAAAFAVSAPVFASTVAVADMNIKTLGLVDIFGNPFTGTLNITQESRTGAASANFNGFTATGVGANSITSNTIGASVDVKNRCIGDCGAATAMLGGNLENNTTSHLTTPGTANFALGDMFISGTTLGGAISGLTRADASTAGATNSGGANATILNTAKIDGVFQVGTTFTGEIFVGADYWLQSFVNTIAPTTGSASSGFGWNLVITSADDASFTRLVFSPDQLNQSSFSTQFSENFLSNNANFGAFSDVRTFTQGKHYNIAINQSSNVTVSEIPEPESLALVGLGLLGLAASRRRKSV